MTLPPSHDTFVTHAEFRQFADSTNAAMHRIEAKLDDLGPKGVNWGWVTSAVLLLGAVIGLYVTPIASRLEKHIELDGHPRALQMHERTNEQVLQNDRDIGQNLADIRELRERMREVEAHQAGGP